MEHLFFYGSLKDPSLRRKIIGRSIDSVKDKLHGYRRMYIVIDGKKYPIITAGVGVIIGEILKITKKELQILDEYETDSYRRKRIILDSSVKAWVYLR